MRVSVRERERERVRGRGRRRRRRRVRVRVRVRERERVSVMRVRVRVRVYLSPCLRVRCTCLLRELKLGESTVSFGRPRLLLGTLCRLGGAVCGGAQGWKVGGERGGGGQR